MDGAETDVPETEEGCPRRRFPRWRKAKTDVAEMDVPETEGAFFKVTVSGFSECDQFLFFLQISVWVKRY